MSIRVANIRLELGEAEEGLPGKISDRLGLGLDAIASWRILRKSLDARNHNDLHFTYSAEVQLAEGSGRGSSRAPPRTSSPTRRSGSSGPSQGRGRCDIAR